MKKIFLNSIIVLLLVNTFIGCAHKNSDVTATDTIGCRMLEFGGSEPIILITAPLGYIIQKSGEAFKDENEKRDLKEVCRDVKYGISNKNKNAEENAEKIGNLSSEKNVSNYENKLNSCIKSHNILDFDATSVDHWNREDIKAQLTDCHLRIKNGETEFELKNYQDNK